MHPASVTFYHADLPIHQSGQQQSIRSYSLAPKPCQAFRYITPWACTVGCYRSTSLSILPIASRRHWYSPRLNARMQYPAIFFYVLNQQILVIITLYQSFFIYKITNKEALCNKMNDRNKNIFQEEQFLCDIKILALKIKSLGCKTRLLGRPQPQMNPPVALNQYTWVNRTTKYYIYIYFKAL